MSVSSARISAALGPWSASKAVSSERSAIWASNRSAWLASQDQSLALLEAFTTSMYRSAKRYTRRSSRTPPDSLQKAEYCACPMSRRLASLVESGLYEVQRTRPRYLELPHVRDVEQTGAFTHAAVLRSTPGGVLLGHLIAGERDHPAAQANVLGVQRGLCAPFGHAASFVSNDTRSAFCAWRRFSAS